MRTDSRSLTILVADDNPSAHTLLTEAFTDSRLSLELRFVKDGVELMEYLRREGAFQDKTVSPRPSLVLLDLNMPRKDGRTALREIKQDPQLQSIPVIVLTSSVLEEDVEFAYKWGGNSFISKPKTFEDLVVTAKELGKYWLEIVELPSET